MGLHLGPLVGKVVSGGMTRSGFGLRRFSGSVSADEWGHVLDVFTVGPEASQHWSL